MRARRFLPGLLGLVLLGACAPDYSAVRDWSVQARESVLPPYPLRPVSAAPVAPAPPARVTQAGRPGAVRALEEAAAAWLAVLAYLADDGLPRERENPFAPLSDQVRPFDAEGAEAVAALGETIAFGARRNWRAPQLGVAVQRGDGSFQAVMAALARQAEAVDREAGRDPAARQSGLARIAEGHALLKERSGRLSRAETARLLRLQASELRRLAVPGA